MGCQVRFAGSGPDRLGMSGSAVRLRVTGDGLRGDGVKEMSCQRQSLIYKCGQSEWEGTGPETCLLPSYLVARGVETLGVICFA